MKVSLNNSRREATIPLEEYEGYTGKIESLEQKVQDLEDGFDKTIVCESGAWTAYRYEFLSNDEAVKEIAEKLIKVKRDYSELLDKVVNQAKITELERKVNKIPKFIKSLYGIK